MSKKNTRLYVVLAVLTFALVAAVPSFAGSSIVGSVAGSLNTTIGGQPAINGSTVFSGDSLKVKDGAAVVTFGRGSRAVFGRNSEVSFSRQGENITAHLASGTVSIFQPVEERNGMRVKFDNVTVGPTGGYKTLGEVAMVDGAVAVRTKEGMMSVSFADGKTTEVPAGEVMRLVPNPQRAPQEAAGSQHFGQSNWVEYAALGAAGVAAVLAGIDISKADNANTNALAAEAAANAATSAANAAASDAIAAQAAAVAAALSAEVAAVDAGCAENIVFHATPGNAASPSPFVPPSGYTGPSFPGC